MYHCFNGDGFVDTTDFRKKKIHRRFFIDIRAAVRGELMPDDAIFAVNQDGKIRSHFAPAIEGDILSREDALEHMCIPVSSLLSEDGVSRLFELAATKQERWRQRKSHPRPCRYR